MSRIAFDIGGTHLRVCALTEDGLGQIVSHATPADPEGAVTVFTELARSVALDGIESIVGGVAGIIKEDGTIAASRNLPQWEGFPFAKALGDALGAPVIVHNDAELAALGEAHYGAGKGAGIVAYIGVGTGVGTARIVDGKIDRNSGGFEAGHQIIDVSDGATLESLIGGSALREKYDMPPESLPRAVWDEITPVFAAGIWNQIVEWSPDVVVLGGSLVNEDNGFRLAEVIACLEKIQTVLPTLPEVKTAEFGDSSALWGALALGRN